MNKSNSVSNNQAFDENKINQEESLSNDNSTFEKELKNCEKNFDLITEFAEENLSDSCKSFWNDEKKKIKRRFKLFDGDKIFIVTTGMLKAGKSTFVNLLSRCENASPIGFGVDTTLRPALITMLAADEPKNDRGGVIRIYKKSKLEEVIDSIRGLNEKEVEYDEVELTKENIRYYLCNKDKELRAEPVLIEVDVPYNPNSILSDNRCVIIDMPGLDSYEATISSRPEEYTNIFKECDYLLFVQSSVSPLNDRASDYLKKFGEERSECTYGLIQNKMNAHYWRKNDEIENEFSDQLEKGVESFKKKVGIKDNQFNLNDCKTANLGMQYDLWFNEDLIDSEKRANLNSEYELLEKWLLEKINKEGEKNHTIHSIDELVNEIEKTKKEINEQIEQIKNREQEINNRLNEIQEKLNGKSLPRLEYQKHFSKYHYSLVENNKVKLLIENIFKENFQKQNWKNCFSGEFINTSPRKFKKLKKEFKEQIINELKLIIQNFSVSDIQYQDGDSNKKGPYKLVEGINRIIEKNEGLIIPPDEIIGDIFKEPKINISEPNSPAINTKKIILRTINRKVSDFLTGECIPMQMDADEAVEDILNDYESNVSENKIIASKIVDLIENRINKTNELEKRELENELQKKEDEKEENKKDSKNLYEIRDQLEQLAKQIKGIKYE